MTETLFAALDELVPEPANAGDWDAVLARAGAGRSRRRRLAVVAVAVAALALAAPALAYLFGLIGRTDVAFTTSPAAPAEIEKRFADIGVGAPPGMAPQVIPTEARKVVFRGGGGQRRVLWLAPIRSGGFCFELTGGGGEGGCVRRPQPAVTVGGAMFARPGEAPAVEAVSGKVFAPAVATVTLEYADGSSTRLPFVYVSPPIDAGFFVYTIPAEHRTGATRPTEVVARDAHGRVVGRAELRVPTRPLRLPPPRTTPTAPRPVPTTAPAPTTPLQRGSADGVSVVAGANGSVLFRTAGLDAARRSLLAHGTSYGCFKLTHEFGIFDAEGLGTSGRLQPVAALRISGVKPPFDGCELSTAAGHRWPDRLDSHAPVEIPLTPAGRRYFADRAAARDLALFVRSARVQRIRKEPPAQALRDLRAVYAAGLARSAIRIAAQPGKLTFTETSPTGKRFVVVVAHGRIVRRNLEPYAKVF
jgi:hypothetical protein